MLRRDEVLPVLAAFSEPSTAAPWRWVAAACIYAGLRPGEAFGLHKGDLDTTTWTLTVRRSWTEPMPKDGDAREVVVVPELRAHLAAAITASRSDLVFSRPDGSPFLPDIRWALVDQFRRALKRAGIVDGYRHICRRKGCRFEETRAAPSEDRCPRCRMRLWVSPVPRKLRFYDLRHCPASLIIPRRLAAGHVHGAPGPERPLADAG